jgi:hypothetical protein
VFAWVLTEVATAGGLGAGATTAQHVAHAKASQQHHGHEGGAHLEGIMQAMVHARLRRRSQSSPHAGGGGGSAGSPRAAPSAQAQQPGGLYRRSALPSYGERPDLGEGEGSGEQVAKAEGSRRRVQGMKSSHWKERLSLKRNSNEL